MRSIVLVVFFIEIMKNGKLPKLQQPPSVHFARHVAVNIPSGSEDEIDVVDGDDVRRRASQRFKQTTADDDVVQLPLFDESVDKDYNVYICDKKIINVAPRVFFSFIISFFLLIVATVYIFVNPAKATLFVPFVTLIAGVWIPSPTATSKTQSDAVQNAAIMRFNLANTSRLLLKEKDGAGNVPAANVTVGNF